MELGWTLTYLALPQFKESRRHKQSNLRNSEVKPPCTYTEELELELIQTQMAQKPMLRAEVYAHAMRASQNRKKGST